MDAAASAAWQPTGRQRLQLLPKSSPFAVSPLYRRSRKQLDSIWMVILPILSAVLLLSVVPKRFRQQTVFFSSVPPVQQLISFSFSFFPACKNCLLLVCMHPLHTENRFSLLYHTRLKKESLFSVFFIFLQGISVVFRKRKSFFQKKWAFQENRGSYVVFSIFILTVKEKSCYNKKNECRNRHLSTLFLFFFVLL